MKWAYKQGEVRTSRNTRCLVPRGRGRATFSALLALSMFCASLLLALDADRIHVRCPEHGEIIHLNGASGISRLGNALSEARPTSAAERGEDLCCAWGAGGHANVISEALVARPVASLLVRKVVRSTAVFPQDVYDFAPKTSPPPFWG